MDENEWMSRTHIGYDTLLSSGFPSYKLASHVIWWLPALSAGFPSYLMALTIADVPRNQSVRRWPSDVTTPLIT